MACGGLRAEDAVAVAPRPRNRVMSSECTTWRCARWWRSPLRRSASSTASGALRADVVLVDDGHDQAVAHGDGGGRGTGRVDRVDGAAEQDEVSGVGLSGHGVSDAGVGSHSLKMNLMSCSVF